MYAHLIKKKLIVFFRQTVKKLNRNLICLKSAYQLLSES